MRELIDTCISLLHSLDYVRNKLASSDISISMTTGEWYERLVSCQLIKKELTRLEAQNATIEGSLRRNDFEEHRAADSRGSSSGSSGGDCLLKGRTQPEPKEKASQKRPRKKVANSPS
jgi:hypothetical protein